MDLFLNNNLLILAIAVLFRIFLPKRRMLLYGYRTRFSRLNNATWLEANKYFANLFLLVTFICYLLSIIFELTVSNHISEKLNPIIAITSIVLAVVLTEKHLKNKFNDDGTEKI